MLKPILIQLSMLIFHIYVQRIGTSSFLAVFTSLSFNKAKGKDGRGVQRGACKGCNECSEFKGDARCDYCNCAATLHTNLIHGSSNLDIPASASKMGNVQDPKGIDGRGIERGKCSGCTECSEFRGDVRCDYCNCTATQHMNLTNLPIEKNSPSTVSRETSENARGKDRQGICRGNCNGCTECLGFTGDARCDYCNCAATQHLNLTQLPSKKDNPSTFSKGALNNAKGKDGRGVKRGKCSCCTECSEFIGDVRCDYCNCAATQNYNCTHQSSSIDTSGHLPRTSQPGIDSRGVRRERCTSCKECSFFSGADRCDYCNCTATEHIRHADHLKSTDPTSSTGITIDWSNAKGKDGRGVQRGACKGCNECSEFKGDARCDYCNCAATLHTNLIHGSSNLDIPASASKMGNVQDPKGIDGRGIERGKCSGCTECSEFRGDVRCDYCNCTATQHMNLTNLPIEKNSPSTVSRETSENARGKDRQGICRGNCNGCTECLGFTGDARCDYCNCAATQHLNLTQLPSKKDNPSTFSKGALNNVHASKKSCISSCTQDYTLRIRVRPHSQQPDGVSQTEFQQQVNNSIRNNKMQIRRNVQDEFGAVFNDIRFENGCIIISMSINQLQRDAEIMLIERRKKIENYAKSLIKDIFSVQFMNLNWHRN